MTDPLPGGEWLRLRTLFEAACALAREDRFGFLEELRGDDVRLRSLLAAMLETESTDDDFLQPPVEDSPVPDLVGTHVEGFRIVRLIARGGMGMVWEAEQDEPRRRVALKTMHTGLLSPRSRRRFRFESELLATLRHPAIAQVLSAGVIELGAGGISVPWFALEYVEDAEPLTTFAVGRRLDLAAKLRLFQTVCNAIQHAHQRGVIHRDLKPANLLVDHSGQVKVIDFGVARVLETASSQEHSGGTRSGEVVGTLETMSPEQVCGKQDEVDARSDVYALGCVLYVLATGRQPHELAGLPLSEVTQKIREVEPVAPSRLVPGLPRELDWIVATALAKDPQRRYASASELEHEIQRVLDREPVLAGPASRSYRIGKFWQRHRLGIVIAAFLVLAVLLGLVGAFWGMLQRQRAEAAESKMRAETRLTKGFSRWFLELFGDLSPDEVDGRPLDRRRLLLHASSWIRSELTGEPQLASNLLRVVGQVHAGYGEFQQARAALREAVALARKVGTEADFDLAEALVRFGQLARRNDETGAAEEALREALAIEERLFGATSPKLGTLLNELGVLLAATRPDEALGYYRRTYEMLVARYGEDHGDAAMVLANMGMLELHAHRYEAAKAIIERALPILERFHGKDDPRLGVHLGNLATIHRHLGLSRRARELQNRDHEITARSYGPKHGEVGMAAASLALISESLGDRATASREIERALTIFDEHFPADHLRVIGAKTTRARLMAGDGRLDAARSELMGLRKLAPSAPKAGLARLAALVVLADVERRAGQSTVALQLADSVLADPLAVQDSKLRVDAEWQRAFAWQVAGNPGEADAARERALAVLPASRWPGAGPHFLAEMRLAVLRGDARRALQAFTAAVAVGHDHAFVLEDPEFAPLRREPEFAAVASALRR